MTDITTYQKTLFRDLHDAWLRLYQATIGIENSKVRKFLLFAMSDCLRWNQVRHTPAMKQAIDKIYSIASRELLNKEFYDNLERVVSLTTELFTSLGLSFEIITNRR